MTSSATLVSPPSPKPLNSDTDDNDEDVEYEEIEEEIEVEEEFEVEEEMKFVEEIEEAAEVEKKDVAESGEAEIGEDLTPVRQENQEIDMDLEDDDEHVQSGSVAQGISASNIVNDIPTTHEHVVHVKISESSEKDQLHVNGERTSGDNNLNAPFYSTGIVNDELKTPLVGDFNASFVFSDVSREKDNTTKGAPDDTMHMSPRLNVPKVRLREPSSIAEFDREKKKLRIVCEFHAKGWCIKGHSCRFLHVNAGLEADDKKIEVLERQASSSASVLPQLSEKNPKLFHETENLLVRKDDTLGTASKNDDRWSFGHNLYSDKYSSKTNLVERNSTYSRNFSSSSITSHGNHHTARISDFESTLKEMISKKNDYPRPPDLPYFHSKKPLSLGSSSWNNDALGTQNPLIKSSFLQRNISPAPCSESENLLRDRIIRDIQPDKYKTKLSSGAWEPSVPFRPSHPITRNLLSKENLYDPTRDGIAQKTDFKDGRVKFSHSDQGSSVKNVNVESNNSSNEEERLLNCRQIEKDNILSSSGDNKPKVDEHRHKAAVVKVDVTSKNEETGVDSKRDAHVQNEAKALKCFHSELVEFVKELVRPTWHEGLLSRDAHKLIVKKSVDKVLSTMQPNQIPSTIESIKSYVSSSRPKLAKLVEAYIDKYGKS